MFLFHIPIIILIAALFMGLFRSIRAGTLATRRGGDGELAHAYRMGHIAPIVKALEARQAS